MSTIAPMEASGRVRAVGQVPLRVWRAARRQPEVAIGVTILAIAFTVAIFAPLLAPYSPDAVVGPSFGAPSAAHPLGLDDGGVDMVTLLMYGARTSMTVGLAAAAVAVFVGGLVGILSGYFGGWVETLLMRITDYFLVIPTLPLMIVVAAVWGSSLFHVILVIGLLSWAVTARVVRAQVLSLRERAYVKRARSLGAGHLRTILRHVLPQLGPLLAANTAISIADAVFAETGLSFLGLGDPNSTSWGVLIENAFSRSAVTQGAWWAIVPPGLCVAIVVVACSLIGRGIEDSMNPRLRVGHLAVRSFAIRPLIGRDKDTI